MACKQLVKIFISVLLLLTACTTSLASQTQPFPWQMTQSETQVEDAPAFPIASPSPVHPEQSSTPKTEISISNQFTWVGTSVPAVIGLTEFAEDINPLTGLEVEHPDLLNRRPLMIKVSNYPRSGRPHAGLSFADVVFEYYIGEQMNRFLAVYYGQNSPQVGPLRSGRLIDVQLSSLYGGILVYGGADPKVATQIINVLQERAITHNITPCPPICGRDTHSISGVFVDSESMMEYVDNKGIDNEKPSLDGLIFDPNPPDADTYGVSIGVEYSSRNRGEWHYDPESEKYLRWIEADDEYHMIPLVDRVNQQQLGFSNIIILYATYIEYAPTLHDVLVWDNQEGDRAFVFRDGFVQEGIWMAPNHEQPIRLYNRYSLPMALKPGNSWIVFLGQQSRLEEPTEGQWEFFFDLP